MSNLHSSAKSDTEKKYIYLPRRNCYSNGCTLANNHLFFSTLLDHEELKVLFLKFHKDQQGLKDYINVCNQEIKSNHPLFEENSLN